MSPNFLPFSCTRKEENIRKRFRCWCWFYYSCSCEPFVLIFIWNIWFSYLLITINVQCITLFWMNFSYLLFLLGWFCMFSFLPLLLQFSLLAFFSIGFSFDFSSNRYFYWIDCQQPCIDACLLMNVKFLLQGFYEWNEKFLTTDFSTSFMEW